MALRAGYKGFKKLLPGLKLLRPGVLGIDIGTGLAIGQDGKLNVTGVDVTVAGNPEEAATAGDLTKLQIGDDIFNVPDTTYSNATTSKAGLMSADDKKKLNGLDKDNYFLRSEHDILGAKNFLPAAKTASANGLTFTVNNDGSVTISGTATADTGFNIGDYFEFKDGSYILSAGEVTTPYIYLNKRKGTGTPISAGVNTGSGEVEFNVDTSEYDQYRATIWVTNGSDYTTPVTLYPMIRLASDPDNTYVPYAMTNRELTEKVQVQTITHAESSSGDNVSVSFTEDIVGNVAQIRGFVVSSVDKDASSQSNISLDSVIAHKPIGKIVGCINSSLSTSDRKPICGITLDGNGSIQISGQMVANRGYDFSFIYVFA